MARAAALGSTEPVDAALWKHLQGRARSEELLQGLLATTGGAVSKRGSAEPAGCLQVAVEDRYRVGKVAAHPGVASELTKCRVKHGDRLVISDYFKTVSSSLSDEVLPSPLTFRRLRERRRREEACSLLRASQGCRIQAEALTLVAQFDRENSGCAVGLAREADVSLVVIEAL
jgi:hypothetical protein